MLGKARRGGGRGERKPPGLRRARRNTVRETRMAICNTLEGWIEGLGDVNLHVANNDVKQMQLHGNLTFLIFP